MIIGKVGMLVLKVVVGAVGVLGVVVVVDILSVLVRVVIAAANISGALGYEILLIVREERFCSASTSTE